jgi:hypothetical protein
VLLVYTDGSVRPLSYEIDAATWLNLALINDGNVVTTE